MADASTTSAVLVTAGAAATVQQGAQFLEWLTQSGAHFPIPNGVAMILAAWMAPLAHVAYHSIMQKIQSMNDAKVGSRRSSDPAGVGEQK